MDREYNKNAFLQRTFGEQLVENIAYCSKKIPQRSEYQVADFGCGPGGNSVKPLAAFIDHKPAGTVARCLLVDVQSDPELWKQLSATMEAANLAVASYEQIQLSFYKPLDKGTAFLDLAWSSTSLQWTSRVSCELEDYSSPTVLPKDSPQRALWAADADEDWRTFLSYRASEIVPGGFLILAVPGCSVTGQPPLMDTFLAFSTVKREMRDAGLITPAECARIVLRCWERTTHEFLHPLLHDPQLAAAFAIERYQVDSIQCPQAAALREGRSTPAEFAAAYTAALRAVLSGMVAGALAPGGPAGGAGDPRCEEFWRRITARMESHPPIRGRDAYVHQLVLRRL